MAKLRGLGEVKVTHGISLRVVCLLLGIRNVFKPRIFLPFFRILGPCLFCYFTSLRKNR